MRRSVQNVILRGCCIYRSELKVVSRGRGRVSPCAHGMRVEQLDSELVDAVV
jgi:hypothetical protein